MNLRYSIVRANNTFIRYFIRFEKNRTTPNVRNLTGKTKKQNSKMFFFFKYYKYHDPEIHDSNNNNTIHVEGCFRSPIDAQNNFIQYVL